MLANLLRAARARLFPPNKSAAFSCIRCGLVAHVSGDRDYVRNTILTVSESHPHPCKPKSRTL
ncbi:hypothetical protein AB0H23_27440 [Streptomyces albogriseolus]|uniref:hypothetical protein n=1 Tax=Streptomyces albogriseolus TaxID=1887 RepID=UPI00345FF935